MWRLLLFEWPVNFILHSAFILDEEKIDLNGGTMNVEENELATSSAERANNDSTEFDQISSK